MIWSKILDDLPFLAYLPPTLILNPRSHLYLIVMPNKANAKKALRQSLVRARRNKVGKDEVSSMRVHFRKAMTAANLTEAAALAQQIGKKLDKLVGRGIMKLNTAARTKSRIMARLNTAKKAV